MVSMLLRICFFVGAILFFYSMLLLHVHVVDEPRWSEQDVAANLRARELFCSVGKANSRIWKKIEESGKINKELAEDLLSIVVPVLTNARAHFENATAPNLPPLENCEKRERKSVVIDAIMVGFELDMLEVRLMELYDVVDFFYIMESRFTHSGINKDYYFIKNQRRFKRFMDKIVYVPLTDAEEMGFVIERNGKLGHNQDWRLERHAR